MEALILLDCSTYSKSIIDILKAFKKIGWDVYNSEGKIEYLPIGDNGMYNWQCEKMSETKLYNIINNKVANNEEVGVDLFFNDGIEGVSFLAHDTSDIMLSILINRRLIDERHTDMVWYLENIIYRLIENEVKIWFYKLEEYGE